MARECVKRQPREDREGRRGNGDGTIVSLGSCLLDPDGSRGLGTDYLITGRQKLGDFRLAMESLIEAGYPIDYNSDHNSHNVGVSEQSLLEDQQRVHVLEWGSGGYQSDPPAIIAFVDKISKARKRLSRIFSAPYAGGPTIKMVARASAARFVQRRLENTAGQGISSSEAPKPFLSESDLSSLNYYFTLLGENSQAALEVLTTGAKDLPTKSERDASQQVGEEELIESRYGELADRYAMLIDPNLINERRTTQLRDAFYAMIRPLSREQVAIGVEIIMAFKPSQRLRPRPGISWSI